MSSISIHAIPWPRVLPFLCSVVGICQQQAEMILDIQPGWEIEWATISTTFKRISSRLPQDLIPAIVLMIILRDGLCLISMLDVSNFYFGLVAGQVTPISLRGIGSCRILLAPRVGLRTPRLATGVSRGPLGPKPPECPQECPPKTGYPRECPKSVPRASPECPGHLVDTPGTLSGHFLDTPEPGRHTFWTLPRTPPVFGDTLGGTLGTLRARRPRVIPVAGRGVRKSRVLVQRLFSDLLR